MRQNFLIILVVFTSCNSVSKVDYKVDKVIFTSIRCRPIFENYSDTGFGNCPKFAIMLNNDLKIITTEGSPFTSKLNCFSGTITNGLWDSLYNQFIIKMLNDSSKYKFIEFKNRIHNDSILDWYEGPEYILKIYLHDRGERTIYYRDYDSLQFSQFLDRLYQIRSVVQLRKINDTTLIDLNEYILMPPRVAKQQIIYKR